MHGLRQVRSFAGIGCDGCGGLNGSDWNNNLHRRAGGHIVEGCVDLCRTFTFALHVGELSAGSRHRGDGRRIGSPRDLAHVHLGVILVQRGHHCGKPLGLVAVKLEFCAGHILHDVLILRIAFGCGQFKLGLDHGNGGRDFLATGSSGNRCLGARLVQGTQAIDHGSVSACAQFDDATVCIFSPGGACRATGEARIIVCRSDLGVQLEVFSWSHFYCLAGSGNLRIITAVSRVLMGVAHDGERGVDHLDGGCDGATGKIAGHGHSARGLGCDGGLGRCSGSAHRRGSVHGCHAGVGGSPRDGIQRRVVMSWCVAESQLSGFAGREHNSTVCGIHRFGQFALVAQCQFRLAHRCGEGE